MAPKTRKKTAPIWDERGASLQSLDASWHGSAEPSTWRELAEALGMELDPLSPGERIASAGLTVLERRPAPRPWVIGLSFHDAEAPAVEDQIGTHWHLRIRRAPPGDAPTGLVQLTDRLGGAAKVLNILAARWPGPAEIECRINAAYEFDGTRFELKRAFEKQKARRSPNPEFRADGTRYHLSPIATVWQVEGSGPKKHKERSIFTVPQVRGSTLMISWLGQVKTRVSDDHAAHLDDVAWQKLSLALNEK